MKKTLLVVPVFGKWDYVLNMVDSVKHNTLSMDYEFLFIVNKHPDDVTSEVYEHLKAIDENLNENDEVVVNVIMNDVNAGVAPSWNQGIDYALDEDCFDSVCFVNDDIIVSEGWLTFMRFVMEQHDIYCVQTQLTEGSMPDDFDNKAKQCRESKSIASPAPGLNGCLFMMSVRGLKAIGKFDEQFEIGFWEDADYLMRIREAGQEPIVSLRSYIHHYCGVSRNTIKGFNAYAEKNRIKFNNKWAVNIPQSLDTKTLPSIELLRQKFGVPVE